MIHAKYSKKVTTQSYGSGTNIEGVEVIESPIFGDDGGLFAEIARLDDGSIQSFSGPFKIKQISMSVMMPGTVKAYHLHKKQEDMWFIPPGNKLIVNLHDVREDSNTFDQHMRMSMGGCKNQILRIPQGVAHGVGNPYSTPMTLFYATTQQFNPKNPDEHRLPWDEFGAEVWEITKG